MVDIKKQHINIIFALNREKNTTKAYGMLKVAFEEQNRSNTSFPSSEEV
jgi:hypothetical protein